jgi:23S rRNA pseudouridine1911/1915/1917 synthase
VGIPVSDDGVYGKRVPGGRQLLHAYQLSIPHPEGGRLTVVAPIPPDFEHAVRAIGAETLALRYAREVTPVLEAVENES